MWEGLWRTVQCAIVDRALTVHLIAVLLTIGLVAAMCAWSWRA